MAEPLDQFPLFADRLRKRWAAGAKAYGNASFDAPLTETCGQIVAELEDVAGWLFILWVQVRRAAGEAIDIEDREDLQEDFLRAMRHFQTNAPKNAVDMIAQRAGWQFDRWMDMRLRLMDILRAVGAEKTP